MPEKLRRQSLSEKPTSTLKSWLDCCNADGTPKRARKPAPKPNLDARIETLKYCLGDIWQTLEDRKFFMKLEEHKGKYCSTCSPFSSSAGTCGPTCSLLSPHPKAGVLGHVPKAWYAESKRAQLRLEILGKEVWNPRGAGANTVSMWEDMAKSLRNELKGQGGSRKVEISNFVPGLNVEWTFQSAWGKRRGNFGGIAPNEVVGDGMRDRHSSDGKDSEDSDFAGSTIHASCEKDSGNGSILTIVRAGRIVLAQNIAWGKVLAGRKAAAARRVSQRRRMPRGIRYPWEKKYFGRLGRMHSMHRFKSYDRRNGKSSRS